MENDTRKKQITKATLIGSVVNFVLVIFKFMAGFLGNSAAMIADAVHSLSDFATDIVVLIFVRISSKPQDEDHNYGHGKYETLATAIIGVVLFAVGLKLFWDGGYKIFGYYFRGEELQQPGMIALYSALASIIAKELLYRYTIIVARKQKSQSLLANAWHHRSDAFSSLGTALGIGGAILLGDNWRILDPIAAVVVSVFILKVAVELILPALNELLEKSLPPEVEEEILAIVKEVPEIRSSSDLCTRCIGNVYAIEIKVGIDGYMPVWRAHELTEVLERKLRAKYGKSTHINLHIEPTESIR
ncbi:cation diffusion facilitator family transporter [Odoribacter sp. OttesenSCG-928-J03]|nr:cation diffusion facilitator family transporter [Odoribacter sp. OttesenSCG-928-J03]MDL2282991.1 cation diffusion facilitator family transporter [Odoribacter sp. OttesenSCG-928-G04]MDL2331115.1 cation diffusion facilitator family transporter [Odoribacter sp. OttesenSCG-928-A06]